FTAGILGNYRQEKSEDCSYTIVDCEKNPNPIGPLIIQDGCSIFRSIDMSGNPAGGINPHRKKCKPRKELNESQLLHGFRHGEDTEKSFFQTAKNPSLFRFLCQKSFHIFGWKYLGFYNRPYYRPEKCGRTDVTTIMYRHWNNTFRGRIAHSKPIGKNIRQHRGDYCSRSDKKALHGKSPRTLFVR